jgi:peptide/nickel transport system ATP-binding protein
MTEPVLSVRDLRVEFVNRRATLRAIDGVSFNIAKSEVLGVVGESGAGKSVTGLAAIGLIDPPGRIAGGEIYLSGLRIDNMAPDAMRKIRGKRIGMIFQDPLTSLNPLYKIGDQLVETIRTHLNLNESAARKRAVDLLAEVGIPAPDKRVDAYPHEFSGGMRQRVVIALAIAAEPELIIADEPTTALDVSVQAQIIALIKRLGRDHGTAVMLVTHDMGVIAETSDRVAVMYSGRIAEIGPVRDVVQNPLHPYAKGLMGAIPTLAGDASKRLVQIPGSMPRLSNIPPGCAFNPRCAFAFDRCRVERPEPIRVGLQSVACHLYDRAATESAA